METKEKENLEDYSEPLFKYYNNVEEFAICSRIF